MSTLIRFTVALLLASVFITAFAQNGRRSADCVELVDSTCVKNKSKQTLVWPSGGSDTYVQIGGIPQGYVERVLTLGPGDLTTSNFQLARDYGGWPVYTCIWGAGPSAAAQCSDGRPVSSVRAAICSGVYEKKLYEIYQDNTISTGGVGDGAGPSYGTVALTNLRSCAAPGSTISYMVKDSGAGNVQSRPLTSQQILAYRGTADAVSGDSASTDALCRAYGGVSTYSSNTNRFNSCADNSLMIYRGGTWARLNACSAGNVTLTGLVCGFAN